jgi:DNA repair protein RadC
MSNFVLDGEYSVSDLIRLVRDNAADYFKRECVFENVKSVKDYLKTVIGLEEREHFSVLFLDSKHQLISFETLFSGTVDSSAVYPREVVKRALELNASALIFAHNHPSGDPKPSNADIEITRKLKNVLSLVEVRVLDHIVVGKECVSMAESGML